MLNLYMHIVADEIFNSLPYGIIFFLYISPRLYKYFLLHPQCHFIVYLKVDGGQLESLRYFDHHTHFISCNHVL